MGFNNAYKKIIQKSNQPLLIVVFLSSFLLSGCFQEQIDRLFNQDTYAFSGTYDNQHNSNTLTFKDGMVSISSSSHQWQVPYEVEGKTLSIIIRHSSMEKRDNIMMRIHGNGEVLTCNSCALHQLSNIWVKVGYVPEGY